MVDPEKFTTDDFLKTTKPFEYVAKFKDDDFSFMQAENIVVSVANKCGIKNFKSMMKKYMEKTYPKKKSIYVNTTSFSNQPCELSCGAYFCDDAGVSIDTEKEFNVEVCNHPIMPIQRLVNIDDNTEKLKIAYSKGGRWRQIIADKETLASSNKILSLAKYGIAVNSENAKHLVKFFTDVENLNFDAIEELSSVSRLGWIGDKGFSPYVDDLVFDGHESYKAFFESVHYRGKLSKWVELCKDIRKNDDVTARIMLAASFSSVLVSVCDCLPFFVHFWGGSGSGKTVGLMLAASVWANPSMGDYIHTFNATFVAQELSAGFVNSLPLIIDELQIIKDKKDFDSIIYQLSEGVGRARGEKSGGLKKVGTWKNCILTNGEFPISSTTSGAGAVNRILEIDCKEIKMFHDPIGLLNIIKKNYGGAGRVFVECLQMEGAFQDVKEKQKTIFQNLLDSSDTTEKQAMSASLILLADELIEDIFFEDNIRLTIEDLKPYLSTKAQINQNQRCLDFLYDFVAINSNKFVGSGSEGQSEVWGKIDGEYIYIIKAIFNKVLQDNGFNTTAFLSWANRNGLILCDKSRHNSVVKKIFGNNCRCVALLSKSDEVTVDDDLSFDI